jgi:DNA repair photolyase
VLHRDREQFHSIVEPRPNIIEETRKQLEREDFMGKTIHLCFTCDPYPTGYDTTPTREIIKLLKGHECHVQILTKGDGGRDLDLLDENDWYGVTYDGSRPNYVPISLCFARNKGIKTWISFEPVVNAEAVLAKIVWAAEVGIDKVKIGKLNYCYSDIDWKAFGEEAECLCKNLGLDYYIKDSLRKLMNGGADNG